MHVRVCACACTCVSVCVCVREYMYRLEENVLVVVHVVDENVVGGADEKKITTLRGI